MKRLSLLAIGMLALPLFLACDDGPTAPPALQTVPKPDDPKPPAAARTTLEVVPESFTVDIGRTYQLRAIIKSSKGKNVIAGQLVEWSSTDPAVAEVLSDGWVRGLASGTAEIIARYEGQSARAFAKVIDLPDDDERDKDHHGWEKKD